MASMTGNIGLILAIRLSPCNPIYQIVQDRWTVRLNWEYQTTGSDRGQAGTPLPMSTGPASASRQTRISEGGTAAGIPRDGSTGGHRGRCRHHSDSRPFLRRSSDRSPRSGGSGGPSRGPALLADRRGTRPAIQGHPSAERRGPQGPGRRIPPAGKRTGPLAAAGGAAQARIRSGSGPCFAGAARALGPTSSQQRSVTSPVGDPRVRLMIVSQR